MIRAGLMICTAFGARNDRAWHASTAIDCCDLMSILHFKIMEANAVQIHVESASLVFAEFRGSFVVQLTNQSQWWVSSTSSKRPLYYVCRSGVHDINTIHEMLMAIDHKIGQPENHRFRGPALL